ncbi:MAG: AAA family ATPase, partial [Terriglobales bacterium]
QHDLDNSYVLEAILDYQRKFKTLPTWTDLEDHISLQQQSAGPLAEYETARKAIEEDHDDAFQSLDVLIGNLEEHVKGAILRNKLSIASRIAGTGWEDPKTKKKLMGADTACAWIANCAGAEDDNSVLEEGEKTIAQGRDGAETFTMTTICADTIKPVAIKWLWPSRFPMGKSSLITGKPDQGKSQVTLDVIARTTTGADWPDGEKNTLGPRDVLLAVAEDDLADTVIPRLQSAGADLSRVFFVGYVRTKEFDEKNGTKSVVRPLQLAADIKKLKITLESNPNIALLVIDTLTSFFGDVNVNADQDIRPVMDGLARTFRDCGAAFIGVSHHNKKNDADAVQAILGASSVAGSVRAAYSCSKDPESEGEFYFTLVKGNLTKKRGGMKFTFSCVFFVREGMHQCP